MWLLVILFSVTLVNPAHAIMMTIEPDDYAAGTNVSTLFPDLTMYRISNFEGANSTNLYGIYQQPISSTAIFTPVYIETRGNVWAPPTGDQSFGSFRRPVDYTHVLTNGQVGPDPSSALMIQFQRPVNYFEIAGSWNMDSQEIYAFDANNQPLNLATTRGTCQ